MLKYCYIILLIFICSTSWAQEINKQTFTYKDTLKLDYYSTKGNIDKNRPLLVVVHGGGFKAGKRDDALEVTFANKMANFGYAVASISYRLTRKGKTFNCESPSKEKVETFVAAAEDIAAAVTFLHNKKEMLQFDLSKTILMGSSAGAEGVLSLAFMKQHYDFNHIKDTPLAGVISLAGAVLDIRYITEENKVPTLMFHGKNDRLVPYGTASHHYCKTDTPGYLILDGSESIKNRLIELNESYIFAFDPDGKHDWAAKGYQFIDLIKNFIDEVIVKKSFVQKNIKVKN